MVALHKISYLDPFDVDVYQTLKSVARGGDFVNLTEKEKNQSFISNDEIEFIFNEFPDLIENTNIIADKCNVTIDFDIEITVTQID